MAQVKRIRRNVSGIILLDKPKGFSSNAALQKVRWLLNAEKAGHTGSHDPLATGVMPPCNIRGTSAGLACPRRACAGVVAGQRSWRAACDSDLG